MCGVRASRPRPVALLLPRPSRLLHTLLNVPPCSRAQGGAKYAKVAYRFNPSRTEEAEMKATIKFVKALMRTDHEPNKKDKTSKPPNKKAKASRGGSGCTCATTAACPALCPASCPASCRLLAYAR